MKEKRDRILEVLSDIAASTDLKLLKRLNIEQIKKVTARIDSYAANCLKCTEYMDDLLRIIEEIANNNGQVDEAKIKSLNHLLQVVISHLESVHKLVPEGYYMSIFLSLGMCVGLVFGLAIFDNIAICLPLGLCLGICTGSALDADAKKKGKVI